jgi:hypothetical protein
MDSALFLTWPCALFFWAVFIWAFAPEFRIVARPARLSDCNGGTGFGGLSTGRQSRDLRRHLRLRV